MDIGRALVHAMPRPLPPMALCGHLAWLCTAANRLLNRSRLKLRVAGFAASVQLVRETGGLLGMHRSMLSTTSRAVVLFNELADVSEALPSSAVRWRGSEEDHCGADGAGSLPSWEIDRWKRPKPKDRPGSACRRLKKKAQNLHAAARHPRRGRAMHEESSFMRWPASSWASRRSINP
jgi:hypothetical protein